MFLRPLLLGLCPIVLLGCMRPEPAVAVETSDSPVLGIDLGSSAARSPLGSTPTAAHPAMAGMPNPAPAGVQMAHEGHDDAHATGTVNAVDVAQKKINISHGPISKIGWPAMTMEFAVAPTVDLTSVQPGSRVDFTLEKGKDGMYEVQSVQPAGTSR